CKVECGLREETRQHPAACLFALPKNKEGYWKPVIASRLMPPNVPFLGRTSLVCCPGARSGETHPLQRSTLSPCIFKMPTFTPLTISGCPSIRTSPLPIELCFTNQTLTRYPSNVSVARFLVFESA